LLLLLLLLLQGLLPLLRLLHWLQHGWGRGNRGSRMLYLLSDHTELRVHELYLGVSLC